jgi:branched-subunit amino acid ABC-type transport system permease component
MSTIGVTFMIEGGAQMLFGSDVYPLALFPNDAWFLFEKTFEGGILVSKIDVWGGVIAAVLVAGLALFFQRTKTGRALRAVADDHAAAQSVGIPLDWIWFVVWLVAGLVALVAATVWGTKLGVQFSITFLALKALPVLIIGGFTSVPGAIVGGSSSALARRSPRPIWPRSSAHRILVCLRAGAGGPAGASAGPVRRTHHRANLGSSISCCIAKPASSRRAMPPTWRSSRSARTASRWRCSCCSRSSAFR